MLTRGVKDLAIVLDVIAGPDSHDAATLQQPSAHGRYVAALSSHSLRGTRLSVITNFRGANAEIDRMEQTALKQLQAQGAVLVSVKLPETFENLWKLVLGPVGEAEFKPEFERYLQSLPATQPKTLAQVINISSSRSALDSATPINSARLQGLRDAEATQLTDSPTYIHILTQIIPSVRQQLQTLMTINKLQAFVFSTMNCPASPRFDRADPNYVCMTDDTYKAGYIASAAGFPEVTVPAGRISGNIPAGYSFMGLPYSEGLLLGLADGFRKAGPRLPAPQLR